MFLLGDRSATISSVPSLLDVIENLLSDADGHLGQSIATAINDYLKSKLCA